MIKVWANCVYFVHQLQHLLTSLIGIFIFISVSFITRKLIVLKTRFFPVGKKI